MNLFFIAEISSYTIVFAAIIGLIRFKVILKLYRPFIYIAIVGFLTEVICYLLLANHFKSLSKICTNIYVLIEFYLILCLFKNWGIFAARKGFILLISIVITLIWFLDNLVLHDPTETNSIFRVCYSTVIVLLGNNKISLIMSSVQNQLLNNIDFLICIIFIFYFSCRAILEVFFIIKAPFSNQFYLNIFLIFVFINLFANLLYAYIMLCLPSKHKFSLQY